MKVVVVGLNYAPEPTGIAPYTTALSRGLAARGHKVRVVTAMPHYPEWRIRPGYEGWARTERLDGVVVQRLRHYVPAEPDGVRRLVSELSFGLRAMFARWGRPDVVLFVSPALFSTGIAMLRARLYNRPSVIWIQDVYSLGVVETAGQSSGSTVARVIRAVESAVLRSAAGVSVIHDRFAGVVEQLGASPDRVVVVRNWTHLRPVPHEDRRLARRRLQWGADEAIVLHSGAMGRKQDLDNVLAAARVVDERDLPIRFVLMGNGGERPRLETAGLGIRSLSFLDPLPGSQYQAALHAADVLLVNEHAGLREMAVPSKLTSYFSSGRPVIAATDAESVTASEVVAADAGIRVEPGNPEALVDAVLEIRADPERADGYGRHGREYQHRVLSEEAAFDRFEALLERHARSRRDRGSVIGRALDRVRVGTSD
jgi:glycosyltransferase involved in cell wall biosynthesis